MKLRNQRGQALVLATFIALLLIVAVPTIMYLNQIGTSHQNISQKKTKALPTAEEGISHALQYFPTVGTPAVNTWNNVVSGGSTAVYGDCNTTIPLTSASGQRYKLTCDNASPELGQQQLRIVSTAYLPKTAGSTVLEPTVAMEALISRKTLSATLPSGMPVSGALMLANVPATNQDNALIVHWGPILCWASDPLNVNWVLRNPLNLVSGHLGHPRKFSNGSLTGFGATAGPPPSIDYRAPTISAENISDQKEYWAFATLSENPIIDLPAYQTAAGGGGPGCTPGTGNNNFECCNILSGNCSGTDFSITNGAISSGSHCEYNGCDIRPSTGHRIKLHSISGNRTVYITGDAILDNNDDFTPANTSNALIVTGNLTVQAMTTPPAGGNLDVPKAAAAEYAHFGATVWPCRDRVGTTCPVGTSGVATATNASLGGIHFRGFLYVGRNLTVAATSTDWVVNGAVQVGDLTETPTPTGQLTIQTGAKFTLMYNEAIQRSILTQRFELQVDRIRGTSPL